jgi:hypothetical protein
MQHKRLVGCIDFCAEQCLVTYMCNGVSVAVSVISWQLMLVVLLFVLRFACTHVATFAPLTLLMLLVLYCVPLVQRQITAADQEV